MLGRPGNWEPVCMKVTPGPWLIASVYIEFTMHISSATLAVLGRSSLIHCPLCPCCLNSKGEPTRGRLAWFPDIPVRRCPLRTESGSSLPVSSFNLGLWSKRSIWEGAPLWNKYIILFAFAGKWGNCGGRFVLLRFEIPSKALAGLIRELSERAPSPSEVFVKKSLLENYIK